jgi:hypothetical protein
MAGLDDLFAEIPVQDIASKLGVDESEVNSAIHTLVPALVGGLQHNVQSDDIDSSKLESAVNAQAASGLLDGGVSVDQVDQHEGDKIVANIFGGNDSNQVAAGGGGLGEVLGSILGGGGGGNNALGSILGSVLGGGGGQGGAGGALGDILGGLLGGKK